MKHRDSIEDICDEFGVDSEFVEFVWALLQVLEGDKSLAAKLPPLGGFKPRTKRECALACTIALQRMEQ